MGNAERVGAVDTVTGAVAYLAPERLDCYDYVRKQLTAAKFATHNFVSGCVEQSEGRA